MGSPLRRRLPGRGLRWAVTVVLAVVAGAVAAGTVQRAEAARSAYGEQRRVPVAATDLEVGARVGPGDVAWSELPAALVPDGVAAEPEGRTVTEPVVAGEVVLERRLSGAGGEGAAALVPPGGRALAVPVDASTPGLALGDRVDAYAPAEVVGQGSAAASARSGGGARRVAREARVVAVDERAVTIAVSAAEAPAVARAVLDGALTLALVAPGEGP